MTDTRNTGEATETRAYEVSTVLPDRLTSRCAVCRQNDLEVFVAREMLLGFREPFEYGFCRDCGAITRVSAVHDLARYYPHDYRPFRDTNPSDRQSGFRSWLKRRRNRQVMTSNLDPLGCFLKWMTREEVLLQFRAIGHCGVRLTSRILDVGCGAGHLLQQMAEAGFQDLTGVDPFVPEAALRENSGLKIIRGNAEGLAAESFELVMMNHCLEHVSNQKAGLQMAARLVSPGGVLLVRQPLCDGEAFRLYRENWCQLDAPRHTVINSVQSMRLLAKECGLRITRIIWDSADLQFWGSEQYRLDVAMSDERSYFNNPDRSPFTREQIDCWKREAMRMNRAGAGDQAAFFFERE